MSSQPHSDADAQLTIVERALSASSAALISAVIVNPLDVAKTRLQAQAAGVPYQTNTVRNVLNNIKCTTPAYKGTIDVLYKVTRQE